MEKIFQKIVSEDIEKIRLRKYLLNLFPLLVTNSAVKKAIKRKQIFVNGEIANNEAYVSKGQIITFKTFENVEKKVYDLDFEVVYEDDFLAIINKPAGISVFDKKFRTIENSLGLKLTKSSQDDALPHFKPVHRLDNQTSGLLIIAKTALSLAYLSKQFSERKIFKRYRAIVTGDTQERGTINSDIENKNAITSYKKIKSVKSIKNGFLSLVDVFPKTGRTHQIRKHLSEIGFPVLGDKLYGKDNLILKHKGLFLCAVELKFLHFITNEVLNINISEPNKFKKILRIEENRYKKYFAEKI